MEIKTINISGPLVIKPTVFYDERGYFYEPYNKKRFIDAGIGFDFVQDNQSLSQKGALRGLHFQSPPFEQGKLVSVARGAVLDVIVDIRKKSSSFGKAFSIELNEENKIMFWIPAGFAHGFSTLAENTIFQYKCSEYYNKGSENGIRWNDEDLDIDWLVKDPIISKKDKVLPFLRDLKSPF